MVYLSQGAKKQMIARTPTVVQPRFIETWQRVLADGIRDIEELLTILSLNREQLPPLVANPAFPLRVPRGFVARMQSGDPDDPLLHQILPLALEQDNQADFMLDPVGDMNALNSTGLLQKYRGRALLITTGACAVHCRYCFRRHFPYQQQHARHHHWQNTIASLRSDTSINELILSGGDPLMLTTTQLNELTRQVTALEHIKRLRIHTRLPIVLPERINTKLLEWLANLPFDVAIIIHSNHPAEIDTKVSTALRKLQSAPVSLLNQSVLLKGINDDTAVLARLSERLFSAGVLPYYLHLLDKVQGAAHFEVSIARAREIHQQLRQQISGYLLPRLVYEKAGASSKLPVDDFYDQDIKL